MGTDLLEYYAKLGLGGNLNHTKPPPKRGIPFTEILEDERIGKTVRHGVEIYFEEHVPYFAESIKKFGIEETKKKFYQLFEVGVLDIYFHDLGAIDRDDEEVTLIGINLIVWDGNKYQFYTDCVEKIVTERED